MIKAAHEAPKSIFNEVQGRTDYDYFLANLLETDEEYLQIALKAVADGRETVLDNGVFETGKALDMAKFADWVNKLKPTYYIVPDVLDDFKGTVANMVEWCNTYKDRIDPKCKMIGVCQGESYLELQACYNMMDRVAKADKIAFSFDSKYYGYLVPHKDKLTSWMLGRQVFLAQMLRDGIINKDKPHHLLGCSYAREFSFYNSEDYSWIDSVDTSSPVIYGMNRQLYDQSMGNTWKPSEKLYTLINAQLDDQQKAFINYNIDVFAKLCGN